MSEILYTIIIYPITQILEFCFNFSQRLFKETGISVIFIGLVISILCLPLYAVAEKWQQIERNIQKKLKPKIDKIKDVFKGDEQYMILSTYYRQNHYHPIYALRSTFGLLIQIPFFIAAYSYLTNLEALKNASFLFINHLGFPDSLFQINGFKINILPIIMTMINCVASAVYVKGLPARDKIQLYGIAGIFLILLYNSPSALVLYWTMNNVFSLVKNVYYRIQNENKHYFLVALFSSLFILLAIFCILKFNPSTKRQFLVIISFGIAFFPWICVIFKKQMIRIASIEYETGKTFLVFLLSVFLMWLVFGLYIPTQLIVSSPQEFSFLDKYSNPLFFIFNTALQVFGFFVFLPICIYFLFPINVRKYFSVVFLFLSLCTIINLFLFPGNYGLISIDLIFSITPSHSAKENIFNTSILLVIIIFSFVLYKLKNSKIVLTIIPLCIFSFLAISTLNILKINSAFVELKKYYTKQEKDIEIGQISPLFSLSRYGKNVVIVMLDRAIGVFIPYIFDESPELKEMYSGFISYPNTVSFNGYTALAAPPLYGGYEYAPKERNKRIDKLLVDEHNESLIMLPRIFSENGFSVYVTDPPYANFYWKSDLSIYDNYPNVKAYNIESNYTDLWLMENGFEVPKTGDILKKNIFWYSLLKGLPLFLRSPLYMDGNWSSPFSNIGLRQTLDCYSVLDYLPRLTEITDNSVNTALIMTNNTTHENSFLQAPDYVPVPSVTNYGKSIFSKKTPYHVNAASIKRLAEWFEYLKSENVYDNTRIILVSDHGPEPNFVIKLGLPFNVDQFNPILLVKDFNAEGEISTDMTFMSNADVPYLSLVDIVDNPVNPFTGNIISMEPKKEQLYIAITKAIIDLNRNDTQYKLNPSTDYYVHDNIFVAENWTPVSSKK
jgi:YidC/Oxa1 family membrane protein insertase